MEKIVDLIFRRKKSKVSEQRTVNYDRRKASVNQYTKTEWFRVAYQTIIRIGITAMVAAVGYLFIMYYQSKSNTKQIPIQWERINDLRKEIHEIKIESSGVYKEKDETIREIKRQLCDIRKELGVLRELHYK